MRPRRRAALPLAAGLCCLAPPALCQPGPLRNVSAGGAGSPGDVPAGNVTDVSTEQGDVGSEVAAEAGAMIPVSAQRSVGGVVVPEGDTPGAASNVSNVMAAQSNSSDALVQSDISPVGSSGDVADVQGDAVEPANASVVQGLADGGANASAPPKLLTAGAGNGATGTVYVLRHGEKVLTGDHLNATGLARAQWVAHLWSRKGDPDHVPPKAIFANFFDQEYNSVELAEPLGRKLNLPVNSDYHRPPGGDEDNTVPGEAMLYALRATGGPILAVWESYNMVGLVRSLGCDRPWLYYYEDSFWGHNIGNLHHRIEEYDRYFVLRLRDGVCEDVRREYEGFDAAPTWRHPEAPTAVPLHRPRQHRLQYRRFRVPVVALDVVLWYLPLIAIVLAATVPRRLCKWSSICGKPPADAEDRMRKPLLEP